MDKGIYITIYSSSYAGSGSLRGIMEAVLVGPNVAGEREPHPIHPAVQFVQRRGGEITIEPLEKPEDQIGPMFGGRIAEVPGRGFFRIFDHFEATPQV